MHTLTHCPKKKMNEKYTESSNSTSQVQNKRSDD
jgi:hypothetical protein